MVFTATEDISSSPLANLYTVEGNKLIVDVTDYLLGDKKGQEIMLITLSEQVYSLYSDRDSAYFPYLLLKNKKEDEEIKSVPLVDMANAQVKLRDGEACVVAELINSQSSVHGVGVDLVCGANGLKLSLEETFDGERWTDAKGRTQSVIEKFYYKKDGDKYFIDGASVTALQDGTFTCEVEGVTYDVTREEKFGDGTEAVTEVKGVKNADLLDSRSDELKQIQEKIKSYEKTAEDLFVWKWTTDYYKTVDSEKIQADLSNKDSLAQIRTAVNEDGWHISTKGELFQIEQMAEQIKELYNTYAEPDNKDYILRLAPVLNDYTPNSFYYSEFQLRQAIAECYENIVNFNNNYNTNVSLSGIDSIYNLNALSTVSDDAVFWHKDYQAPSEENPIPSNNFSPYFITGRDLKRTLYTRNAYIIQLEKLQEDRGEQEQALKEQRDYYVSLGNDYLSQLETIFKEYSSLKEKEREIIKNTPVRFIRGGESYKGFNQDGELIIFFKSDKVYASVNRDKEGKIVSLTDEKENAIHFNYKDNELASLSDVRGRNVLLFRDGNLTAITYPDGSELKITTESATVQENQVTRIIAVEKDGITANIEYDLDGKFKKVTRSAGETQIDFAQLNDGAKQIIFDNYDKSQEIYSTISGVVESKYLLKGGIVVEAVRQNTVVSNATEIKKTVITNYPTRESLYSTIGDVSFLGDSQTDEYDGDGNALKSLKVDSQKNVSTQRIFNGKNQCIKEVSTVTYGTQDPYEAITEHSYNALGLKVKTVSYVIGEELTNGKTVEEWVYDGSGKLLKAFTYNSLDSSSKFYTSESLYNENGLHVGDLDQTGEHKTEVEYVDKTSLVKAQKTEGGATFAYGYDLADRVTSITQSTEDGEESSTQRVYENGLLKKLVSGNTVIEYTYDNNRRLETVKVNGVTNKSYEYENDGKTITLTDKDGIVWVTVKDDFGNVISVTKNGVKIEENTYENGLLKTSVKGGVTTTYSYDEKQRLTSKTVGDVITNYAYDDYGNITTETTGSDVISYNYSEDSSKTLQTVTKGGFTTHLKTDVNGRNASKIVYDSANYRFMGEEITYLKKGDHATKIPQAIKYFDKFNQGFKDNLRYAYDEKGNICQINEDGKLLVRYAYDGVNRLIREDNAKLNKTYIFEYDGTGNITSKRECSFTLEKTDSITAFDNEETYIYDGDKLIRTSSTAKSFYNANDNLTVYLGYSIAFKEGGLISSFRSFAYEYDLLGRRTKKGVVTYTYDNDGLLISQSDGISYIYDHNDQMVGVKNGDAAYYFRKNLQGDIISLLDSNGLVVVRYYYDAWGNHKVCDANGTEITDTTHIGHLNPIRYRGYYYDKEFGLYYLKSRYYDPTVGRFITQDDVDYADYEAIGGLNLYAYCNNNPVMHSDPTGHLGIVAILGIIAIVGAIVATANDIYQITRNDGEGLRVSVSGDNVQIENSYKIITPWMRFAYAFYLNHFNPSTKDIIQGSTVGVQFEWALHNYAAWLGIGGDSAKHLDVGKTIFADGETHPLRDKHGKITSTGLMSLVMRVAYIIFHPVFWILDLIENGGF